MLLHDKRAGKVLWKGVIKRTATDERNLLGAGRNQKKKKTGGLIDRREG